MSPKVSHKPILVFDSSGINKVADDCEALITEITTVYHTQLTGSNIGEIAATATSEHRDKLLDTCQRLLASGECIDPFSWIVENQVKAFEGGPTEYVWRTLNVVNSEIRKAIIERTLFDDEMARQFRESARTLRQSFEDVFCSMRSGFDEIFANGTERPKTFREFVNILQKPAAHFGPTMPRTSMPGTSPTSRTSRRSAILGNGARLFS
jgi:hypothetical protein